MCKYLLNKNDKVFQISAFANTYQEHFSNRLDSWKRYLRVMFYKGWSVSDISVVCFTSLEDNVGLGVSSRGERGTSSLQLTDSDDPNNTGNTVSATRKKRSESWNSSRVSAVAGNESDSHNENISPMRPNTRRKRKFKRMAIDPMTGSYFRVPVPASSVTPSGTIKRKKGRSKSGLDT